MKAKPIFVCDFDGVIADSAPAYVDAINIAAQSLGASRLMTLDLLATMPSYQHVRSAQLLGLEEHSLDQFSQALRMEFHRQSESPLHLAMRPVLCEMKNMGRLVLLSANEHHVLQGALDSWQMADVDIFPQRGEAAKTQKLEELSRSYRVVMIGDTLNDCRAAAAAGVHCIAVTWGWQCAELLQSAGVPMAQTSEQLLLHLRAWNDHGS